MDASYQPRQRMPARAISSLVGRMAVPSCLVLWASALLWLPLDDMVIDGLFTWHLTRPQTVQGGLELIGLYALVAVAVLALPRGGWSLLLALAVPIALYLRRHHVDLPAAAALLYLEAIIATGGVLERGLRRPHRSWVEGVLVRFLLGLVTWSLIFLALSAVGVGGPPELRLGGAVVGLAAFGLYRRPPAAYDLVRALPRLPLGSKLLVAFFLVELACLFARSNVTVYHDSLWYSLRGEYVLAPPGGSIFDHLGMVYQVHFYPKLLELLTLPLSGLRDFSFVLGFSIAHYAVLLLAIYALGRRLDLPRELALMAAALAGTLPAVANVPLLGKPDLFAALLLCLAALYFWDFVLRPGVGSAALGFSCVALSLATKVTSLPYSGILVLSVAVGAWWRSSRRGGPEVRPPSSVGSERPALYLLCGSFLVLFGITFRTYLLTGLPTIVPSQLVELWQRLGFSLRYPVGIVTRKRAQELAEVPSIIYDFLFEPTQLPLVRITWTGNCWLFLLGAAAVLGVSRRSLRPRLGAAWTWIGVILSGAVFALLYNNAERGGDGNYYMFPLILATVLSFGFAARRANRHLPLVLACSVPFVASQALFGFITAAWAPGTKVMDLDFTRTPFDTNIMREQVLSSQGLGRVGEFLVAQPGPVRVVGLGPEDVVRWLPARFESLRVISYARPSPIETPAKFLEFLRSQEIDFVLMTRVRGSTGVEATVELLRKQPGVSTVEDTLYELLDIRNAHLDPTRLGAAVKSRRTLELFELVTELEAAEKTGQGPLLAPWGQTIARADSPTELYTGAPSLIMSDGTSLTYELRLPDSSNPVLTSQVGIYPPFQVSDLSDGVQVRVWARPAGEEGGVVATELEVGPRDGFLPIRLPLSGLAGKEVEISLAVFNRSDSAAVQDWVVWVRPRVLDMGAGTSGQMVLSRDSPSPSTAAESAHRRSRLLGAAARRPR